LNCSELIGSTSESLRAGMEITTASYADIPISRHLSPDSIAVAVSDSCCRHFCIAVTAVA
jgi:hypothetical protein